jgi:hypothetical protein
LVEHNRSTPFRVTSLWRPVRTASGNVIDGKRRLQCRIQRNRGDARGGERIFGGEVCGAHDADRDESADALREVSEVRSDDH